MARVPCGGRLLVRRTRGLSGLTIGLGPIPGLCADRGGFGGIAILRLEERPVRQRCQSPHLLCGGRRRNLCQRQITLQSLLARTNNRQIYAASCKRQPRVPMPRLLLCQLYWYNRIEKHRKATTSPQRVAGGMANHANRQQNSQQSKQNTKHDKQGRQQIKQDRHQANQDGHQNKQCA